MPLQLHHAPNSHIPAFVALSTESFYDSNEACNRAMFPGGPTPAVRQHHVDFHIQSRKKRGAFFLAVYDVPATDDTSAAAPTPRGGVSSAPLPPPEAMIAGARLRLEDPVTIAEPQEKRANPPGVNEAAFEEFFSLLGPLARKAMGSSTYWSLDILATATGQQGRGAGKLIVEWMVRQMQETRVEYASGEGVSEEMKQEVGDVGVPGFIEAMVAGKPLYTKMGFEVVEVAEMDCRKYGGKEVGRFWVMVRPADGKKASGTVNGVVNGIVNGTADGPVNGLANGTVNGHTNGESTRH